ncbi:MAG: asparagine synthase (glutamine-hydrolyzing) [Acidobacteria bacterium]|nr:asparagine synthase (glutamine-hydrolyzing) [Acidobacteriota bacterium]
MCAICGTVNFNDDNPVHQSLIERMTTVQAHRGPDDSGYFIEGNVGLGHRRLSIIDLSGGRQPIFNEDGSVVVVFNGEIYNFAELTAALIARGHRFKTRSDTETIVHAYEEFGDDCVQHFRGMFAFAIWDRKRKRLFIARDRLGIKPVYFYQGKDFVSFASEIKSLLEDSRIPAEVNVEAVDLFLALRYVPGPATVFRKIYKLQPGHVMVVEGGRVTQRKYWDIKYDRSPQPASLRSATLSQRERVVIEEFEHLFEESVRLRLIAEVPLGVFLSGGLDSSATLAMMSRITGRKRIKTFSVGYDSPGASHREAAESNEFDYAREAAAHFDADHYEYRVTPNEFAAAVPKMVSYLDEPLGDPSCIPLYFISKLAREYITVVLSGEGADEMFGGYGLYRRILTLEKMRQRVGRLSSVASMAAKLPIGDKVRTYLLRAATPLEAHYRGVVKGLSPETRLRLTGANRLLAADRRLDEIFDPYFQHTAGASTLNRMLYADAKVWLPENLLLKADKMTMATAVELRVPFLDHKLVEFSASLPDIFKIREGKGKWILRQSMGTQLPPSVLHRAKKGFPSPAGAWLRFELRDFVRDTLLARGAACRQFFDAKATEGVIARHEAGKSDGFQDVWSLVVLEHWYQRFIRNRCSGVESQLQGYYVVNS